MSEFVLTLACPDRPGIVHSVATFLLDAECNIEDSQQFLDRDTGTFFMRVHFSGLGAGTTLTSIKASFEDVGQRFAMAWKIHDRDERMRTLMLVSKSGHCLNDLLFRYRTGTLPIHIPAIVSNHKEFAELAHSYGLPFHYLPVDPQNKDAQEQELLDLITGYDIELVVLARYMQILSANVCERLAGNVINIHHSFLPSFRGAMPYSQAYARGVKLIGATAHYVTADLDEGPIIEQDVARVEHSLGPNQLAAVGRDVECQVLARAVKWHTEHRVLLNGVRTVVFR
ncbi:MAG TPA: formyltetrahydrofolate deformylase [Actinocrinis sp.]|nr:formyltetrahydrofolate deformylase [Actinocrinis sp.]